MCLGLEHAFSALIKQGCKKKDEIPKSEKKGESILKIANRVNERAKESIAKDKRYYSFAK